MYLVGDFNPSETMFIISTEFWVSFFEIMTLSALNNGNSTWVTKKKPSDTFPLYWLFNRDPHNIGLLQSQYNGEL